MREVLVVDDNPKALDELSGTVRLALPGIHVHTAENVSSAVALIGARDFELVVTDYWMADSHHGSEGGSEVILAALKKNPKVPVILVTGVPSPTVARTALQVGAFYVERVDGENYGALIQRDVRTALEINVIIRPPHLPTVPGTPPCADARLPRRASAVKWVLYAALVVLAASLIFLAPPALGFRWLTAHPLRLALQVEATILAAVMLLTVPVPSRWWQWLVVSAVPVVLTILTLLTQARR